MENHNIDVNDYLDSVFKNAVTKLKDKQDPFGVASDNDNENYKDTNNYNNNSHHNTNLVTYNNNTNLVEKRESMNSKSSNIKEKEHARQISQDFVSDLMSKEYSEDKTNVIIKESKHIIKNSNVGNSFIEVNQVKEKQNDNIFISSFKNFQDDADNNIVEVNNKEPYEEDKQLARNLSGNLVVSVLSKDYKKPNELNIPSERETHKKSSDFNLKVDKISIKAHEKSDKSVVNNNSNNNTNNNKSWNKMTSGTFKEVTKENYIKLTTLRNNILTNATNEENIMHKEETHENLSHEFMDNENNAHNKKNQDKKDDSLDYNDAPYKIEKEEHDKSELADNSLDFIANKYHNLLNNREFDPNHVYRLDHYSENNSSTNRTPMTHHKKNDESLNIQNTASLNDLRKKTEDLKRNSDRVKFGRQETVNNNKRDHKLTDPNDNNNTISKTEGNLNTGKDMHKQKTLFKKLTVYDKKDDRVVESNKVSIIHK